MARKTVTPEDIAHADQAVRDLGEGAARLRDTIPRIEPQVRENERLRGAVAVADGATLALVTSGRELERGLPTEQAIEHRRQSLDSQIADRIDEESGSQYATEIAHIRKLADQSANETTPAKSRELMDEAEANVDVAVGFLIVVDAPCISPTRSIKYLASESLTMRRAKSAGTSLALIATANKFTSVAIL
ncbi:MAG: hypothetical protein ABID61_02710 [Candidatus Micrarchaeota archaeon]